MCPEGRFTRHWFGIRFHAGCALCVLNKHGGFGSDYLSGDCFYGLRFGSVSVMQFLRQGESAMRKKQTRQESSPIHKQTHYKWCVSSSLNIVCACCHLICCVTAKVVCVCVLILVCWLNKCDLLWESGVAPVMRHSLARSCTRVSRPPHDPLQSEWWMIP